ncbi:MAG: ORF6N domain-containing protein [Bacteriovoracaceae bacterium]
MSIKLSQIQNMIYLIRGQRVMIDSDLAKLYDVETSALNRQVRRNLDRFPNDFMFELNKEEFEALMCQNGISKKGRGGRTKKPIVFTELGVAMLSSVLKSGRAAKVNISIMRTFVKLRSYMALEDRMERKVSNLEQDVTKVFKIVFERLDKLEEDDSSNKQRRKTGLNSD